jgi:O-antigen/teichoic acid export membrane protein
VRRGEPAPKVDYLAAPAGSRNLGRTATRGAAVTLAGQWSGFVIQTLAMIVLARLLTPRDYGIVAGVAAIAGLAEMLKDLGLGAATVQRKDMNDGQLGTLFWVNAGLGVVVAAAVAALAPFIARFYDEPEAFAVTLVLAIPFVFSGLSVQHQALLSRTLQFRRLTTIDILSRATGLAGAIVLAVLGAGYWALVAATLITAVMRCAQLWRACTWRPSRPRWAPGMQPLLSFGGWTSLFAVVNYVSRNADNVLIGHRWGAADLGVYSRAYQLLLLPLQQINAPLSRVALPTLSHLQDQPVAYRRYYKTAMTAISFITLPAMALMAAVADELVRTLLGAKWAGAGPIFQVLVFAGMAQTLGFANGWLYQTTGHARRQAIWGVVSRTLTVGAFFIGLPHGPYGVAVAYAISTTALMFPGFAIATRGTPVSIQDIGAAVWRPAVIAAVTFGIAWGTRQLVIPAPAIVVLLVCTAAAAGAFAIVTLCWPAARRQVFGLTGVVGRAMSRKPGA